MVVRAFGVMQLHLRIMILLMRGDHIGKNLIDFFFFSISGYFATITFSTKYQENTPKYTYRILHLNICVRHFCYHLISTEVKGNVLVKKIIIQQTN